MCRNANMKLQKTPFQKGIGAQESKQVVIKVLSLVKMAEICQVYRYNRIKV